MNRAKMSIAHSIGSLEVEVASRAIKNQELLERLREIKKLALGTPRYIPITEIRPMEIPDTTMESLRADTIAHLERIRDLLREVDLSTLPDSELMHLGAGCDLAAIKVYGYQHLRNSKAAHDLGREG